MNCVVPQPGFLKALREICNQYQSLLIFDEVITGFRVSLGGAQEVFDISPDLTTLGKIIGGGLPIGAFGGKKGIMQLIAPIGPVYQAGTLSGNPISIAAGLATLNEISKPNFYETLEKNTSYLLAGIKNAANECHIPMVINQSGSLFGLFFTEQETITTFDQVKKCDVDTFKQFFHQMLQKGIYLAPSAYESGFVSNAHQLNDLDRTIQAATEVFSNLSTSSQTL
jgi:glutamate-1-semialdehyde 2,1-aminomutase